MADTSEDCTQNLAMRIVRSVYMSVANSIRHFSNREAPTQGDGTKSSVYRQHKCEVSKDKYSYRDNSFFS